MNETKIKKGKLEVQGSIAYVEQEPFIFSASVKENILFGSKYDAAKFKKTVEVA